MKNALLQCDGRQRPKRCCGQIHRQHVLDEIRKRRTELQAVATGLLHDFKGRVPLGVTGGEHPEGLTNLIRFIAGQISQLIQSDRSTLEIKDRFNPRSQGR